MLARLDDCQLVPDRRLRPGRQRDRARRRRDRSCIRAVDEPGVGFAKGNLADDALDVRFLADDVLRHIRSDSERVEDLPRVDPDRDGAVADHDLQSGTPEVVDRLDLAGV